MTFGILRPKLQGRVKSEHVAPSYDALELLEGQTVAVGEGSDEWPGFVWCTNPEGKGGWVPEAYLDRHKAVGVMRCDYSSAELSVMPGDKLVLRRLASGWYWASDSEGNLGWVPTENVQIVDEEGDLGSKTAG